MSEHRNAKSKAPKGKPSDINPKGSGLKKHMRRMFRKQKIY